MNRVGSWGFGVGGLWQAPIANFKLQISNCKLQIAIGNRQSQIGNRKLAIGNWQSQFRNRKLAIRNRNSAIANWQSQFRNRNSAIANWQLAIGNRQLAIEIGNRDCQLQIEDIDGHSHSRLTLWHPNTDQEPGLYVRFSSYPGTGAGGQHRHILVN